MPRRRIFALRYLGPDIVGQPGEFSRHGLGQIAVLLVRNGATAALLAWIICPVQVALDFECFYPPHLLAFIAHHGVITRRLLTI